VLGEISGESISGTCSSGGKAIGGACSDLGAGGGAIVWTTKERMIICPSGLVTFRI